MLVERLKTCLDTTGDWFIEAIRVFNEVAADPGPAEWLKLTARAKKIMAEISKANASEKEIRAAIKSIDEQIGGARQNLRPRRPP